MNKIHRPASHRAKRKQRRYQYDTERLENRLLLSTITWTGASGGNWTTAGNWSGGAVPTINDDVVLQGSANVVSSGATISAASVTSAAGSTLTVSGNGRLILGADASTFSGTLAFNNAAITVGSGLVTVAGTSSFQGTIDLAGHTLVTTGTVTLGTVNGGTNIVANNNGAGSNLGGTFDNKGTANALNAVNLSDHATIQNEGTYNLTTDNAGIGGSSGSSVLNTASGIFQKTAGTGTSNVSEPFDNQGGTVQADSGILHFSAGASTGGTYNAQSGATVELAGTFTGSYTGSGAGTIQFSGGSEFTVGAAGATLNFPAGLFQAKAANLDLAGNTLTNTGTLTMAANIVANNNFAGSNLGGTFDNQGTVNQSVGVSLGDKVTVKNDGTFIFASDSASISGTTGTAFVNSSPGLFEKTVGTASSAVSIFDNQGGTVDAVSGTISLNAGVSTGGTYVAATGAVIDIAGQFTGTYTGSGGGLVRITGGGTFAVGTGGATLNFPAGLFQESGPVFDLAGNTLTNIGTMTVGGTLQSSASDGSGTLDNKGTVDQAASVNVANLNLSNNVAIVNEGIWDFVGDGSVVGNTGPTFTNTSTGTFEKTGGSGTSGLSGAMPFSNLGGTIIANSGKVQLAGTGTSTGGTYNAASGAVIDLNNGGSPTWTGTYTGSGAGKVQLVDGEIQVGPGGAIFDFPGNLFQWAWNGAGGSSGGVFISSALGDLTNIGTINFTNEVVFDNDGTLYNYGTINADGYLGLHSDSAGTTSFVNEPGGQFLIGGTQGGIIIAYSGQSSITNQGTILNTATSPSSIISNGAFSNTGTIETNGGRLIVETEVNGTQGPFALDGGTWEAAGGGQIDLPVAPTANASTIILSGAGSKILGPDDATSEFNNLTSNTGTINLQSGATLTLPNNFANSGTFDVGIASKLTVKGTLAESGVLDAQLGGSPGSGQFGNLTATGAVTLGGTLQAEIVNGYTPASGDAFTVLSAPSISGTFANYRLPSGGSYAFTPSVTGTSVVVTAAPPSDLAVQSINSIVPTTAAAGQTVTVTYTVANLAAPTLQTTWTDSVFISPSSTLGANSILLGKSTHQGALAQNGTYQGTVTGTVPGLSAGSYYIIVEADSPEAVADSNRANNILASSTAVFMPTIPSVTLSTPSNPVTPTTATLAAGQTAYYALAVPGAETVAIGTTSTSADGVTVAELYQSIPNLSTFDQQGTATSNGGSTITIPNTQSGSYYILVQNNSTTAAASYTIGAQVIPFGITRVSSATMQGYAPSEASNPGTQTFTISGAGFSPGTTVTLAGAQPTSLTYVNNTTLWATFTRQLYPLTPGRAGYGRVIDLSLVATDGGQTANSTVSLLPTTSTGGLSISLSGPSAVRPNRTTTLYLTYTNNSSTDLPAPIIALTTDNGRIAEPGTSSFVSGGLLLFGYAPAGPAGTLSPGESNTLALPVQTGTNAHFLARIITSPGTTMGAQALQNLFSAPELNQAASAAIDQNLATLFGGTQTPTEGEFQQVMDNTATYLGSIGTRTSDANALLSELFAQACDYGQIQQRNTTGAFGMGVPDPNVLAVTDSSGNVAIEQNGGDELFTLTSTGYQAQPGDPAKLALSNGIYQLTEADGALEVFNSSGTLNYLQTLDGDRMIYGYTGGLLTSTTDVATAQVTSYAYDGHHHIVLATDPLGNTTNFTYDSSGQFLTSVQNTQGTTSFTYVTGTKTPADNAVASIAYPKGLQTNFTYNSEGQISGISNNGGADPLTFSYSQGQVVEKDALGDTTTLFLNSQGEVLSEIDPMGNVGQAMVNAAGQATSVVSPGNLAETIQYDAMGGVTGVVDPMGHNASATYNATDQLQTLTDPAGNSTTYAYDGLGNLSKITAANGSSQQYAYDAMGQVSQFTNAAGQTTGYAYNAQGLVTSETLSDGTSQQFTYDAHGNMTSATNASGAVNFTYDSQNRLTRVAYSNGEFLQYVYNALGQRSQMTDQTGYTVNYQYDALGRISELTDVGGNQIVIYTYNAVGALAAASFGNGAVTNYSYDADGNLTGIVNLAPGGAIQSENDYTYNTDKLPITMTTLAGVFSYGYDGDGQLISVKAPSGEMITYEYDAAGNRTAVIDNGTTTAYGTNSMNQYTTVGSTTYQYDANGNLISSTNGSGTTTYSYNILGQLKQVVSPTSGTTSYTYDALGGILSQTQNGTATTYLVDPTGIGNVVGTFGTGGNPTAQYAYGNGLVSELPAGNTAAYYSFDATGNTTQLTGAGGTVLNTYSYLPFGQVLQSTGSLSNPFTFTGQSGVLDLGGGMFSMRSRVYSSSLGRFLQSDPTGSAGGGTNLYYYARNSPTLLIDPSGNVPIQQQIDQINQIVTAYENGQLALSPAQLSALYNEAWEIFSMKLGPSSATVAQYIATGKGTIEQVATNREIAKNLLLRLQDASKIAAAGGATIRQVIGASGTYVATTLTSEVATLSAGTVGFFGLVAAGGGYLIGTGIRQIPGVDNAVITAVDYYFPNLGQPYQDYLPVNFPKDPNNIIGPSGFGADHFIQLGGVYPYQIDFTNEPTASAAAAVVTVTEQLDPNLDWTTFQLGNIGFGQFTVSVPAGLTTYSTRVDATSTLGVYVDVNANFDVSTGLLTCTLTSLDPTTLDVPFNPALGVLPPDDSNGDGEGFIDYTVFPKSTTSSGTTIAAQASVVFDTNAALATPQFVNVIDDNPPTSTVLLPAVETNTTFTVNWAGNDGANGSGIANYSVFVSTNGGAFQPFVTDTTATSASFTGVLGDTYGFYSVATDNVGNVQPTPGAAQATVLVATPNRFVSFSAGKPAKYTDANGNLVTLSMTGPGSGQLGFFGTGNSNPITVTLIGTTGKSRVTVQTRRGSTTLYNVQVNGSLAAFSGPTTDLGGAFSVTGTLGNLTLHGVTGTDSTLGVTGVGVPTIYHFGAVQDLELTSASVISMLTASSWTSLSGFPGSITAPSITTTRITGAFDPSLMLSTGGTALNSFTITGPITGGTWTVAGGARNITAGSIQAGNVMTFGGGVQSLLVRGNDAGAITAGSIRTMQAFGSLSGLVTTTGGSTSTRSPDLATLSVTGSISNAQIRTAGSIGSVTAGGISGSDVFAGVGSSVTTLPASTSDFSANAVITSVNVRGTSVFSNSLVAASSIGTAVLRDVNASNGGIPFGIATESLRSVAVYQPRKAPFVWTRRQKTSLLATLPADLKVELV